MICSSVYFFTFTGALLMTFYHTGTLRATGLVFGGKVTAIPELRDMKMKPFLEKVLQLKVK
jgi:hypothetical protein